MAHLPSVSNLVSKQTRFSQSMFQYVRFAKTIHIGTSCSVGGGESKDDVGKKLQESVSIGDAFNN